MIAKTPPATHLAHALTHARATTDALIRPGSA
jgi:hypothetical protein